MKKTDQIEKKHREKEDLYSALLESASDKVFIINDKYEYLTVNTATANGFKKPASEIIGKKVTDLFPKEIANNLINNLNKVFHSGNSNSLEEELFVGGQTLFLNTVINPVKNEQGKVTAVLGVMRDVTDKKITDNALKDSEETLKAIFDNANDGILLESLKEKKYVRVNKAICEMTGYSQDEIGKMDILGIHPKKDLPYIVEQFEKLVKKEISIAPNIPLQKKDGIIVHVDISASPITIHGECYLLGNFRDITERKQAEEALHLFKDLVEYSSDAIGMSTADGRHYYQNQAFNSLFGNVGEHPPATLYVDPAVGKLVFDTILSGGEWYGEVKMLKYDGTILDILLRAYAIKDQSGRVMGLVGLHTDITERKKAEEKLRETNEYLNNLFNYANAPIIVWDAQYRITRFNHAFESLTGRAAKDVIGGSIEILFPPKDVAASMEFIKLTTGGERWEAFEIAVLNVNGSVRTVLWNSAVIFSQDGKTPIAAIAQGQDITGRKEMGEALKMSRDYLGKIINAIADPVFVKDMNFKFVLVNDALCKILGMERENILGKTLGESLPKEQMDHFLEVDRMVLESGQENLCEEPLTGQGGKVLSIVTKKTRYIDEHGNKFLVGVIRDVTERKKAEEEIKFRNVLLSTQQEVSIDGILVVDEKGKIISFNKKFIEIWGIPRDVVDSHSDERALGSVMDKLLDPDEFLKRVKYLYEHIDEISREEVSLKDGRCLDRYSAPMSGADGKYYGRVWYFRDITERREAERSLKDSQESFKLIFEDAPDAYYLNDMKGNFIDGNKETEKLLEYKKEDLIGKSFLKLGILPRDQILKAGGVLAKNLSGLSSGPDEFVLNRKNKTKIQVEILSRPVNINGKKLVLGIARDITKRKLAEETLRDSEEKFKALLNSAPDAFFVYNGKGTFIEGNLAAEKLIGYSRDELIGKSFLSTNILSADQLIKGTADLAKNALGIETNAREYILNRKDGSKVAAEINSIPIKIKGRQYILGVARDLTERKRIDAQLKKAASDWMETFDAITDVVTIISPEHTIVNINKAGCKMFDKTKEELIGKKCFEIVHKMNHPINLCPLESSLNSIKPEVGEVLQDGMYYQIAVDPVLNEKGECTAFVHIIKDITERKTADDMKEKLLHKIEDANRNKTQFVSDVSHELRTPLASIKGFVSTVRSDPEMDEPTRLDFLRIAEEETDRLTRIIEDLLDISRVESGRLKLTMRSFNIIDLLMKNIEHLKPQADLKEIKIQSKLPSSQRIVYADVDKTLQVITNLLSNAIKYNKQGGKVVVSSSQENGNVKVNVEDTGIGIAEKDLPRIFEKFFRTDEAAAQAQGTGLGLPVTKGLVESMGGELTFKSKHGEGSNFSFTLPRQKQEVKA